MIQVLTALLTPTVAILGVYIAIQQYQLAKEKHRIEIYDRRMRIYITAIELIRNAIRNSTISEDAYYKYEEGIAEAEFLFGKEVIALLNDMSDVGFNILLAKTEEGYQEQPINLNKANLRHADIFAKFLDFEPRIRDIFAPYLRLPISRVKKTKVYGQRIADTIPEEIGEEDDVPF
jgi:hypothetical protein